MATYNIINVDETRFKLNGISYYKAFMPIAIKDKYIRLVGVYESRTKLIENEKVENVTINGNTFNTLEDLVEALIPYVFLGNEITSVVNRYITNYNNEYTTVYNSTVNNAPDEEDLTEVNNELKLKDREKSSDNEFGYKILRSDFNFENIPSNFSDSIWEIRNNFNLSGLDIILPDNVILYMNGGSFTNYGSIDGNGAHIIDNKNYIFKGNGSVEGFDVDFLRGEWFGTSVGEPSFDNSVPIMRAFDCAIKSTKCSKIKLPAGELFIHNPIIFLKPNAFYNVELEGAIMPYNNPAGGFGGVTVIRNTIELPFALGIQGARGVTIRNLVFDGDLTSDFDIYDLIDKDTDELIPNSNRYAPECGIVIDPFGSTVPTGGGYDGLSSYYNSDAASSSKILIEKCAITDYKNGIVITPNGQTAQADSITIDDLEINNAVNAVITCQSQSRRISFTNCDIKRVKYCFNTLDYGFQQGIMPEVVNLKIADGSAWIFKHNGGLSYAHFINVYAETLYGIGYASINKYPCGFVNSTIKLTPYTDNTKKYPNPCILKAANFSLVNTSITVGGGESHKEPLVMDVEELSLLNAYLDSKILNFGVSLATTVANKIKDFQSSNRKDEFFGIQVTDETNNNNRTVSYDTGTELYTFTPAGGSEGYTTDDFVFGRVELIEEPFVGGGSETIFTVLGKVESVDSGTGEVAFKSNLLPTDGNDFTQRIAWKLPKLPNEADRIPMSLEIGDWNMDTDSNKIVSHGLSATEWKTVRNIEVTIRNDADNQYIKADLSQITIEDEDIELTRETSGVFDNTNYDDTSYNRGWITFTYIPD